MSEDTEEMNSDEIYALHGAIQIYTLYECKRALRFKDEIVFVKHNEIDKHITKLDEVSIIPVEVLNHG